MFSVMEPHVGPTPVGNVGGLHERIVTSPINLGVASPTVNTPKQSEKNHYSSRVAVPHQHPQRGSSPGPSRLSKTAPSTSGFHSFLLKALQEDSDEDEDDDGNDLYCGDYEGQMELVTSPSHQASQAGHATAEANRVDGIGLGGQGLPDARAAAHVNDIRIMLASGQSTPVEVLRNQVVTSLTLKLKPDWMSKAQTGGVGSLMEGMGMTRKLLLADGTLPEINELEVSNTNDLSDYRNLVMRLCDLQYICIKAAVDVSETGEVSEREYWLPLDKTKTVADIKRMVTGADKLEMEGPKLLDDGETENDLSIVHAGRPLSDNNTMLQEGLTHNTVVHLFVKKEANITVKMRGTKDLEVQLNANETAESLRAKLEALRPAGALRLKPSDSQLFYGGQELKDGPLNMYGITDGATLELRPYSSPKGVTIPARQRYHSWNASAAWKPAGATTNSWASNNSFGIYSNTTSASNGGSSETSSTSDSPRFDTLDDSSPTTAFGSPDLARSFDMARQGLAMGKRPQLAKGGTGGAYFLHGSDGQTCAVFKPADEEPNARNNPKGRNVSAPGGEGLRKGTRAGEGAAREVVAYLLDHGGFAGVPATSLANLCEMRRSPSGRDMVGKLGSLQAYVRADAEAEEMGPALFPVHEVHKITQLDIRLANTDRNAGNILVQNEKDGIKLVPIDHGYALPHTLEDVCFEWEFWPQAKLPYSEETRAYIASIDVDADLHLIRGQGIELQPSSERILRICTILLQKAAASGCCPADIAGMMSRSMPNRMSDLEKLTNRAASQAVTAVRAQDGLVVHLPAGGNSWDELDNDERLEARFVVEYEKLLASYLEGFEPELDLDDM